MEPNQEKIESQERDLEQHTSEQEGSHIEGLTIIKDGLDKIEQLEQSHSENPDTRIFITEAKNKIADLYEKFNNHRVKIALGSALIFGVPSMSGQETIPDETRPEKTEILNQELPNKNLENTISVEMIKDYEIAKERALEEKNTEIQTLEFYISIANTPEEEYVASKLEEEIKQEREKITSPDFALGEQEDLELIRIVSKNLAEKQTKLLEELTSLYQTETISKVEQADKELLSTFKEISKLNYIKGIFNAGTGVTSDGFEAFGLSFPELPTRDQLNGDPEVLNKYFTEVENVLSQAEQKIDDHTQYMRNNPDEFIDTSITEMMIRSSWKNTNQDKEKYENKKEEILKEIEVIKNTTVQDYLENGKRFDYQKSK